MNSLTTFDSTKELLSDMLRSIQDGKTQLPDFQRGWIWDDDHIRSLLASVSLSYPIGAVMMLQTGNDQVRFKPRFVEGVDLPETPEPERLILDGQQRLTSLFQALFLTKPVVTRDARGNKMSRWYYVDIAKTLSANGDRDEAIIGLPEDRITRNFRGEVIADYSSTEKECAAELLPLWLMYDTVSLTNWQMQYLKTDPTTMAERLERWNQLLQNVIHRFQQYQVPLILLRKETPKEAVCQVFEKVNTGGVSLTVFELLTATYAADNYALREDWAIREKRLRRRKVLEGIQNTDFLQALTLLSTQARRGQSIDGGTDPDNAPGISCKRKDILRLTLEEYKGWAEAVTIGFERAARFLASQKIFASRDVPYRTQITPLAAILATLGDKSENDGVRTKLSRWYWSGVIGELYGGAIETRFAKDLPEVVAWVNGGEEPSTVTDANFFPARLLTLRTRNSAAYKGIYALLMRDGALDFRTGDPIDIQLYFDEKIDIHHIFPQDWCKKNGIAPNRCDSIVNKAGLSAKTNRMIGGNAPSVYLPRLQKQAGTSPERQAEILGSHLIASDLAFADDFDAFFKARESALLARIEKAMGKQIVNDVLEQVAIETDDYEMEEDEA
jgi:hypothetical protein